MENNNNNINFYENHKPDFKKSEDDLWSEIESKISDEPKAKNPIINWYKYSAAASILLIVGFALSMRFYTINVVSNKGQHLTHILPDGSTIELNAETSLSYNPYWWRFNRELSFAGEGFFNVAKGKQFSVISDEGITTVLGTSFNIFARNLEYKVFCKTGKVKVKSSINDVEYKITANQIAIIDNLNKSGEMSEANANNVLSWKYNKFSFINEPLINVFEEIERQYNIEIEVPENIKTLKFGASFDKPKDIVQALNLVCIQFDLTFEKSNNKIFIGTK